MPNRIVREGILTSDRVDRLDYRDEVIYRRLLSIVDDFGRYDGRVNIILAAIFPLRIGRAADAQHMHSTCIACDDIEDGLKNIEAAGLICRYVVGGKPFIEILDFRQQTRAKSSRWPAPQMHSTCAADAQRLRTYTDTYSETETETNTYAPDSPDGEGSKDSKSQSKASDTKAAESIYAAYPRKVGKQAAIKAIVSAIARMRESGVDDPALHLLERAKRYAASKAGRTPPAGETDYRPHPATWFNAGRYDDDPGEWDRASGNTKATVEQPKPELIDGWVGR